MPLKREQPDGYFVASCDECGEVLDLDTDDYQDACDILRRKRWLAVEGRHGHGWEQRCPGCR